MNITKQEALNKIQELQKFVEDLDQPKFREWSLGDVYRIFSGSMMVTILSAGYLSHKFILGGLNGNVMRVYSDSPRTRLEMNEYLKAKQAVYICNLNNLYQETQWSL